MVLILFFSTSNFNAKKLGFKVISIKIYGYIDASGRRGGSTDEKKLAVTFFTFLCQIFSKCKEKKCTWACRFCWNPVLLESIL